MKTTLAAAGAILLSFGVRASAHRLDEYLQATIISVEKNRVHAEIRLTPGVAVFPIVFAGIDTDGDGTISGTEQRAYAERVLRDLSFTIDGDRLRPRLISMVFPKTGEMKEGLGEIELEVDADLPLNGPRRQLIIENHHQSRIGAYLINCLVPRDPDIRITAQNRNYTQSFYELDYVQAGARTDLLSFAGWSGARQWLCATILLLFARFAWVWRQRV